jgi:predicted phosphodiesterase
MRVACLYDIHGNLPALEAVVAEIRTAEVDRIVIGGDVLPGPMPRECLDMIFSLGMPTHCIMGNGDRQAVAARGGSVGRDVPEFFHDAMHWTGAQLTLADKRAIIAWPLTLRLDVPGIGDVLFCHATPRNDSEIFVKTTPDATLQPIFDPLSVKLVVCGHTHMQFDRTVGRTRIVNAGSVGMPFQEPGAYWALLGPGVELRRTGYDLAAAAARVTATTYPHAAHSAAAILSPSSEQSMLEQFSKAELT